MLIEVQFSIYPVREEHISPFIERAVEIVKSAGLPVEVGAMSSTTYGESAAIFKAFDEIIEEFDGKPQFVLVSTISNACPVNLKKESSK
jgi:uncharacterized protein YqgV (UPF0045/DUF77 family)